MRILADMGISPVTVRYLSETGHDAVHLASQGLHRASDEDIVLKARREDRVILTVDLDFADLMAFSNEPKPSVIIFRMANKSPASINAAFDRCLGEHQALLEAGVILSVSESAVRARTLPVRRAGDG